MGSGFDGGVERRVLLLFAALTLLPMLTFGFFALQEIGAQTVEQAERGLRAASKDYALRLLERLEWLSARRRVTPDGKLLIMDRHAPKPSLAAVDGALVIQRSGAGETVTVRFADLFRDVSEIGGGSGRCVLINSIPVDCALPNLDSERYVSATWPLFLNSMFESEFNLAVVSFRERAGLLGAVSLFGKLLPPTTALTSVMVCWLALLLLRRRFLPLKKLRYATERISAGDYAIRVNVSSGDEFEALGSAFNVMTDRIETSFSTLKSLADIDRLILSNATTERVIESVLSAAESWGETARLFVRVEGSVDEVAVYSYSDGLQREVIAGPGPGDTSLEMLAMGAGERSLKTFPVYSDDTVVGMFVVEVEDHESESDHGNLGDLVDRLSVAMTHIARSESLYRQAHYDSLTGLMNREAFEDRVTASIARAQRSGAAGAVLFVDLDGFKRINDTEGHKAGDRLLVLVATRLREVVREVDVVARLGGDEFGIDVSDCDNRKLTHICRRILEVVQGPTIVERIEHAVGASIGVAVYPMDGTTAEELLTKADAAMYRIKGDGGGRYAFFDRALDAANKQQVLIESRLRQAIKHDQLELHFQPKLNLADGSISTAEGLMRWKDDELGSVAPDVFVPVAEQTGLIHEFAEIEVARVAELCTAAEAAGITLGRIAINVSTKQLMNDGFARKLLSMIAARGLTAAHLELEVTESVFARNARSVILELHRLREAGMTIALDDFGTGFSSLNMLRELPLDVVKIDQVFIVELEQSAEARMIVEHLIQIVTGLGKTVVAEGVETEAQLDYLTAARCHMVQGFLVSRPVPAADLLKLTAGWRGERGDSFATGDPVQDSK